MSVPVVLKSIGGMVTSERLLRAMAERGTALVAPIAIKSGP
jgi:hypothetical protein